MSKQKKNIKLVPELRFPEFVGSGEWDIKNISSIAENLSNKRVPITSNVREKGEIPYYGSTGVIDYVKDFIFNENLLLISEDGANLIDRNYPIAYSISGKSWVNNHAHVLKPVNKFTQTLVEKYINSISIVDYITGQAQPKLNKANLNKIPIPLPQSPQEQQKIANCLSSLDQLITAETEKLSTLKDHKKGLLQQLFPAKGETVPKLRFPEFVQDGEWEETILGKISKIATGSSNREDSTKEKGKYTFFDRSEDIRTSNRYLFDGEAIIVAGEGQKFIPKYFTGKFDLHQRAYAIMNFDDKTVGKFLFYSIYNNRDYLLRYAVGSTVKSLRLPIFENMPTLVPINPKEQQKIANTLTTVDALITAQTEKIEALKEHKKGLMQGMFPKIKN